MWIFVFCFLRSNQFTFSVAPSRFNKSGFSPLSLIFRSNFVRIGEKINLIIGEFWQRFVLVSDNKNIKLLIIMKLWYFYPFDGLIFMERLSLIQIPIHPHSFSHFFFFFFYPAHRGSRNRLAAWCFCDRAASPGCHLSQAEQYLQSHKFRGNISTTKFFYWDVKTLLNRNDNVFSWFSVLTKLFKSFM